MFDDISTQQVGTEGYEVPVHSDRLLCCYNCCRLTGLPELQPGAQSQPPLDPSRLRVQHESGGAAELIVLIPQPVTEMAGPTLQEEYKRKHCHIPGGQCTPALCYTEGSIHFY